MTYGCLVLRNVTATRYVEPLREGGSLPGLVEADDLGTYVAKFAGAGQGRKALVAEIIAGELARRLGFRVPELVTIELDSAIARLEPDPEVQDLLQASVGRNLGVDFLPGALGYEPLAWPPDAEFAGRVVWFDALVENVDRSWRNPNVLVWHGNTWLIDHGASLYFHHSWQRADAVVDRVYDASDHVFAPYTSSLAEAHAKLAPLVDRPLLDAVTALVPDEWLTGERGFGSADDVRAAYVDHLLRRLHVSRVWLPELVA